MIMGYLISPEFKASDYFFPGIVTANNYLDYLFDTKNPVHNVIYIEFC